MRRMIWKLLVTVGIPFIFLGLSVSSALSQDHKQIRLAIVDVGVKEKIPDPFLDVLLAAFNRYPDVALLERTEINRLLKEQALSLSLSNTDFVKAGKLLAADSLLMLESGASEGQALLRCRLVDTHYGFKLWDTSLPFPAKPEEYQIQAEVLARQATQKISKIKLKPENLMMLGVSNFSSEELSPKWEWLSDAFATAVEQNLALYPGVILLERTKTGALRDERTLVAGLPEALRASAVLIDGSYKMLRDKGPDAISVYVRCRKPDRNLVETRIEGSTRNLGELYPKVVAAILASLGKKVDSPLMQPEDEAAMLANDARAYLKFHDPEQAVPLAEAALSLTPNSPQLKALMLEASFELMSYSFQTRTFNNNEEGSTKVMNLFIATAFKIYPLVEEVLLANSVHQSQSRDLPGAVGSYFSCVYGWFSGASRNYTNISLRQKESLQEIIQTFWHLYRLCFEAYPEGSKGRQTVLYVTKYAFDLCNMVEDAIRLSRDTLLHNKFAFDSLGTLISRLRNPGYAEWTRDKGAAEKMARYLEELTQADKSKIRLLGEWASVKFYNENLPEKRKHFEKFVDVFKKEDLLVNDEVMFYATLEAATIECFKDAKEDAAFKMKHFADILEYAFQKQLINKNPLLDFSLAHSVRFVVEQYNKTNRTAEAAALLQRAIDEFKSIQAADVLQRLKLEISGIPIKTKSYRSVLLYSSKGMNPELHFRRLLVNDKIQAAVYSDAANLSRAQFGIMQLSPDALAPISSQLLPFKMKYDNDPNSGMNDRYEDRGPGAAGDDRAVYLGFPQGGIIVSPKDGSRKLLTEDTGLASERIRSLEILDGKLYAAVGRFGRLSNDNGLMEVDLKTGISTILFSNKSKDAKGEIDGALIAGIAADPERHALWILCSAEQRPLRLYRYYPQDKKLDRVENESIRKLFSHAGSLAESTPLRKMKDSITFLNGLGSVLIETKTETATLLLNGTSPFTASIAKWALPPSLAPYLLTRQVKAIPVNHGLIVILSWELLYFHDGEKDPEYIEQSLTGSGSQRLTMRDIAMTKKGLLVLTDDSLYLFPDIVESSPAVSSAAAPPKRSTNTFNAALIKPSDPATPGYSFRMSAGRIDISGITPSQIIQEAYNVRDSQVSGGPEWMNSDMYDIAAKIEGDVSEPLDPMNITGFNKLRELLRERWRGLLAERFQLKIRRETKKMNVYILTRAKNGSKLKESIFEVPVLPPSGGNAPMSIIGPGMRVEPNRVTGKSVPLDALIQMLTQQLGRPVIDKTNLNGTYDFTLKWTLDPSSRPSIFTAIQEQLGLKLTSKKMPVDSIVIESVEKPSGN
jgi:uncharacterized protein (TIGR03435 family)